MSNPRLFITVTESEKVEFAQKAALFGMSQSHYGHWRIFGAPGGTHSPVQIMHAQSNVGLAHSCARRMVSVLQPDLVSLDTTVRAQLLEELADMLEYLAQSHAQLMPPDIQVIKPHNAAEAI